MRYSLGAMVLRLVVAFFFFSSIALSQGALTQYTTITLRLTDTEYITSTLSQTCDDTGGSSSGSSGGASTSIGAADSARSATTWTTPDGETIVSSASVVVIGGSQTVTLPSVSSPTVLTAGGETFALSPFSTSSHPPGGTSQSGASSSFSSGMDGTAISPTASSKIVASSTSTVPPPPPPPLSATATPSSGISVVSTTGVIIVGTNTIPVPTGQTTPVTLTTDGFTFTFSPPLPQSVNPTASPPMSFLSSGSVVIIGTDSFSIPTGNSIPVTTTRDGFTFTFPPVPQQTVTTSNGIIFIGTDSFPVLSSTTTITRDGVTLTFPPTVLPSSVSGQTASTTTPPDLSALPTFTTWPPDASIIPVITDVPQPQYKDGKTETPCKIWFFWVCVSWIDLNIHIGGWQWILPPGIYPGPPPPGFIKLPPGMTISGGLPPWPTITMGQNHIPTYSSEPTECKTDSVPFCAITTLASATAGLPTVTSCTPIFGCDIEGTTTSTMKSCSVSTVTNFVVSCNTSSATPACRTISSVAVSECGITATTSTTLAPACTIVPTNYVDIVEVTSETTIPTGQVTIMPTGPTATAPPTLTGLPKLSSSSVSTLAGGSCASSAVSSQCFGGAQDGCMPTTICVSWIATTGNTAGSRFLSSTTSSPIMLISTMTTVSLPTSSGICDDTCKLDRGYPCNCNESGCDTNSPACCASGTCQWMTRQEPAMHTPLFVKSVDVKKRIRAARGT